MAHTPDTRPSTIVLAAFGLWVTAMAVYALNCSSPADPPPYCKSRCGLRLEGIFPNREQPTWICEEFQRAEDLALAAFARRVTDPRFKNACRELNGYSVWQHPKPNWIDRWGRDIQGVTECSQARSQICSLPFPYPALVHEMAHIIQRCSSIAPADPGMNSDHMNWARDGIYLAIEDFILDAE